MGLRKEGQINQGGRCSQDFGTVREQQREK